MKDHKAYCDCSLCKQAREIERRGKPKRRLPKFVLAQIQEKAAREEEFMLSQGKMLVTCPKCNHRTYMKIGPEMKCGCCMHVIK